MHLPLSLTSLDGLKRPPLLQASSGKGLWAYKACSPKPSPQPCAHLEGRKNSDYKSQINSLSCFIFLHPTQKILITTSDQTIKDFSSACRPDAPQQSKGILKVSYIWTLNSDLVLICEPTLLAKVLYYWENWWSFPDSFLLFPIAPFPVPLLVLSLLILPMYVCDVCVCYVFVSLVMCLWFS